MSYSSFLAITYQSQTAFNHVNGNGEFAPHNSVTQIYNVTEEDAGE